MGNLLRKTLAFTLILAMVLSGSIFVFAQETANEQPTLISAQAEPVLMTFEELMLAEQPAAPAYKPAVMLNGDYIAFPDAVPQNINGRVMVPFRAILEELGAFVDYNTKTKEITAVLAGTSISFYAGNSNLVINDGETSRTVTMDVAPFIDKTTSRTYVSTRFVAEAFGLAVDWDSSAKTVIIIDFDAIAREITQKFSIIGLLFSAEQDFEQTYKTTGNLGLDLDIYKDFVQQSLQVANAQDVKMALDMDIEGMSKGLTADVKMDIKADLSELYEILGAAGTPDAAELDAILNNLNMKVKMDDKNIYINMPVLSSLVSGATPEAAANTWYSLSLTDAYATYEAMGIDFEEMLKKLSEGIGFEGYVDYFLGMAKADMDIDTYYGVCAVVALLEECIGDEEFTKSGNTYKLTIDKKWLAGKLKEIAGALANDSIAALENSELDFTVAITINATSAGKLSSYAMSGNLSLDSIDPTFAGSSISFDANSTLTKGDVKFVMNFPDMFKITLTSVENVVKTTGAPDTKLPAGATVIDLMEIANQAGAVQ